CSRAFPASIRRLPASAVAPTPRGRPATLPPRTWSTCCTASASKPASIWTGWSTPDSGSRRSWVDAACRAQATLWQPGAGRASRLLDAQRTDSVALRLDLPDRPGHRPVRGLPAHTRRNRGLGLARRRCEACDLVGDRAAPRTSRRRDGPDRAAQLPVRMSDARPSDTAPVAAPTLPGSLQFIERDWLSSNQVLGYEGDAAVVVDTGYAKHAALTVELVRRLVDQASAETGRSVRLTGIVNTHLHSDHCGGNQALAQAFDCPITIPAASAADVAAWDEGALTHSTTGQRCARFRHAATLAPGDTLRLGGLDWRVLAAPGHDPKSLVFHCEREAMLISADALWEHGFGVIFPELDGQSGFDEQQSVLEL